MTQLTDEDHGTLRDVAAIDLDTCPPGSMVYVETDKAKDTIYITTIIPAHHHGDIIHGASVMGPTPFKGSGHGPKPASSGTHLPGLATAPSPPLSVDGSAQ